MDRDLEILARRASPLIFGVFGHKDDMDGQRIVLFGGSGIFVAPFLAITARHVSSYFLREMDWRGNQLPRKGYFQPEYSSGLFQAYNSDGASLALATWQVNRTWDPVFTDICLMQVSAEQGESIKTQRQMPTQFFEWALLPPPIGSEVVMFGYPKTGMTSSDGIMKIDSQVVYQIGRVTRIEELSRDKGMMNFPCFQIDKPVDNGFSGGPVFWDNKLCGIVSSGFEEDTWIATLWPLCLLEYECPDLGSIGSTTTFGNLFESGVLQSQDWPILRNRISKQNDDAGRVCAHIKTEAA